MDANKFMVEYKRMCDSYEQCFDCPLGKSKRECNYFPSSYTQERIDKIMKTVEEWAAAHPRKLGRVCFWSSILKQGLMVEMYFVYVRQMFMVIRYAHMISRSIMTAVVSSG